MYSVIAEDWKRKFYGDYPQITPIIPYVPYGTGPAGSPTIYIQGVSQEEFDKLKKEMESLKKVLIAAKIYDEETNQKDCEKPELIELLRKVAEAVGVKIEDALPVENLTIPLI